MKLIIVDRAKPATYARLKNLFADDLNVEVVWDRRSRERRRGSPARGPERRSQNRRKFDKPWKGKDYVVIYIA